MTTANFLVGTWKLLSFELRLTNGAVIYPFGREVVGQLMYSSDGHMAGSFMKAQRPSFASGDVMAGTPQECDAAMKTYVSYAGTYRIEHDRVIHHAEVSLFPNWTGTDIVRVFALDGNTLTLSTPPMLVGGTEAVAALVWEKVAPLDPCHGARGSR